MSGWLGRGLSSALVLRALMGCLDLDALRERAADGSVDAGAADDAARDGCDGTDVRALRFWKLHLGEPDYVTLKNPTDCPIALGGVQLFLDDHSELFPDYEVDCAVQLPDVELEPGAEVRVHERALPGDIDFAANVMSGCGAGFSLSPERGGVSYLCDGECGPDTVIDAVAYTGEELQPPPARFGQRFDFPLVGVTVASQDKARFRRIDTTGRPPTFHAVDWVYEARYVHAGFDRTVDAEVGGTPTPWLHEDGQMATFDITKVASVGEGALSLTHRGASGRSDALVLSLPADGMPPAHVSYFVRMDHESASGAYFVLEGDDRVAIEASFAPSGLGTRDDNAMRTEVTVAPKTWYQMEFRNIDWSARRYDLYIDRVLVGDGLRFAAKANKAERLSLYGVTGGMTSYWDEIELWRVEPPPQ